MQGLREKVERSFDEALADRGDATLSSRESVEFQDAKVVLAALFWLECLKNEHVKVYVLRLCYVCSV